MTAEPSEPVESSVVAVRLLGSFEVQAGASSTGAWPRPTARRLLQLVLVSPGRRISPEAACEALFPSLSPEASANALYKALSLARTVLAELGAPAGTLLRADRGHIWVSPGVPVEVDLDTHEEALRAALALSAGKERDCALSEALLTGGNALEDESAADWALRVRGRIDYLRQEARLELARDRSRGLGRARPEKVLAAWQACFEADPTDEEAASALIRLHVAQGRRPLAIAAYERCNSALASLGLKTSHELEEVRASVDGFQVPSRSASPLMADRAAARREERRLVTVVCVGLDPVGLDEGADPEDMRELIGLGLAQAISEVEALGGTVAAISGSFMSVLFGTPQSHEDDPERALRSALGIGAAAGRATGNDGGVPTKLRGEAAAGVALSVRIGVETGAAVVGPVGSGDQLGFSAVGAVTGVATALQSAARPGSVLVGPATRAATDGIFEWGPCEILLPTPGARPLTASYLVQPKARPTAQAGRRRLAAKAPLVGRDTEVAQLAESVRATVAGRGGAVVIAGEAGLGKTRLVAECRNYFMGWVGAASARLPLWLELVGKPHLSWLEQSTRRGDCRAGLAEFQMYRGQGPKSQAVQGYVAEIR